MNLNLLHRVGLSKKLQQVNVCLPAMFKSVVLVVDDHNLMAKDPAPHFHEVYFLRFACHKCIIHHQSCLDI